MILPFHLLLFKSCLLSTELTMATTDATSSHWPSMRMVPTFTWLFNHMIYWIYQELLVILHQFRNSKFRDCLLSKGVTWRSHMNSSGDDTGASNYHFLVKWQPSILFPIGLHWTIVLIYDWILLYFQYPLYLYVLPRKLQGASLLSISEDMICDTLPVADFQRYAIWSAFMQSRSEWNYCSVITSDLTDARNLKKKKEKKTSVISLYSYSRYYTRMCFPVSGFWCLGNKGHCHP